jgi:hypothetical protein
MPKTEGKKKAKKRQKRQNNNKSKERKKNMARVIFKKGQPIQSLSGTIGRYTYRTINGKTFVHASKERVLPDDASRKEKALFKRESMLDQCTEILQNEMADVQEAIRMRSKIRSRLRSLYEKYRKEIKGRTKLQTRIMSEYRGKWHPCADPQQGGESSRGRCAFK